MVWFVEHITKGDSTMPVEHTDLIGPETLPSPDDIAGLIWSARTEAMSVEIRIGTAGMSRNLDRVLERWLAEGKLTRAEFEAAAEALTTIHNILDIPVTN